MRLWSIHPKYLDTKALLAVWREGLLAKKVLEGKTKGYKHHPQLFRFRNYSKPLNAINAYLAEIYKEAKKRKYSFDKKKIKFSKIKKRIAVSSGQIDFEFKHLLKKLKSRDKKKYEKICLVKKIKANPIFSVIPGKIEDWERR